MFDNQKNWKSTIVSNKDFQKYYFWLSVENRWVKQKWLKICIYDNVILTSDERHLLDVITGNAISARHFGENFWSIFDLMSRIFEEFLGFKYGRIVKIWKWLTIAIE